MFFTFVIPAKAGIHYDNLGLKKSNYRFSGFTQGLNLDSG